MGIRFACHHCKHPMHLKDFQAGKRGKCPSCQKSFRIPIQSAEYSLPIEESIPKPTTSLPNSKTTPEQQGNRDPKIAVLPAKSQSTSNFESKPSSQSKPSSSSRSERTQTTTNQASDGLKNPAKTNARPNPERGSLANQSATDLAKTSAQWYVRPPSGGQYGPADSTLLKVWIEENRVTSDTLLWCEGQTQWGCAKDIFPDLFGTQSVNDPAPALANQSSTNPSTTNASPIRSTASAESEHTISASTIELKSRPAQKRIKSNRNQWVIIAVLASVCLCLVIGLVAVLFLQK